MAKKDRLKEIEIERGKPLVDIIPPLVNQGGQAYAARKLGVSQATISNWLRANGYEPVTEYRKVLELQER